MKHVDFSSYIVVYNFVIGLLLMLGSQKAASFAAALGGRYGGMVERKTHVAVFAFGACIAALSASIYVLFHLLRIGVD